MKKGLLLLLLLSGFSCSLDPVVLDPEIRGDYFAYCTLSPTYPYQQVIVGKTFPEDYPEYYDDARVVIRYNDQAVSFESVGDGKYRDLNEQIKVLPETDYDLEVKFSSGNVLTAQTHVPGAFNIHVSDGDTLNHFLSRAHDPLKSTRIAWSESRNCYYYTCMFTYIESDKFWSYKVDSFRQSIYLPSLGYRYGETLYGHHVESATLFVVARDSSFVFRPQAMRPNELYQDFLLEEEHRDARYFDSKYEKMHFQGGMGVFNAVAMDSVRIFLAIDADWGLPQ